MTGRRLDYFVTAGYRHW